MPLIRALIAIQHKLRWIWLSEKFSNQNMCGVR